MYLAKRIANMIYKYILRLFLCYLNHIVLINVEQRNIRINTKYFSKKILIKLDKRIRLDCISSWQMEESIISLCL